MKGVTMLCRSRACYFAISCCTMFTGLVSVWGQPVSGFSEVHFDGTFLFLGQHILDTSDIGVLLQRTNANFKNLSKSNGKDISWDSDGVRYTEDSKDLKLTWVLGSDFLHYMDGHPTHLFTGKLSIFEIEIVRNKPISKTLLSKYGFEAVGDHALRDYQLEKNGWKINIITDQDRDAKAVTLEHSLRPD
jgi:hypothetical protein